MMPSDIPGYYWDPNRRKYFKIVADHAATASSSYSKSAVSQEEQKQKVNIYGLEWRRSTLMVLV